MEGKLVSAWHHKLPGDSRKKDTYAATQCLVYSGEGKMSMLRARQQEEGETSTRVGNSRKLQGASVISPIGSRQKCGCTAKGVRSVHT